MNSTDLESILANLLDELSNRSRPSGRAFDDRDDEEWKDMLDADGDLAECVTTSYQRGGYLTHDAGMVVKLADGSEFQITIVQTANAEREADAENE